jgi:hypothetical protein
MKSSSVSLKSWFDKEVDVIFNVEQEAIRHVLNTHEIAVFVDKTRQSSRVYGHSTRELSEFVKPFVAAGVEKLVRTSCPPFTDLDAIETNRLLLVHDMLQDINDKISEGLL